MPTEATREQVIRLVAAGAQLVEVLPRDEYEEEHIAGALNLPLKELSNRASAVLDASKPVVVYCWDSI